MKTSITDEKIAEAASLYKKGATLKTISERFGYSVSRWHQILSKREKREGKVSERDLEMLAAHRSGRSFGQIAAERKMTRQRAHQIVKRTRERLDRQKQTAMVIGE